MDLSEKLLALILLSVALGFRHFKQLNAFIAGAKGDVQKVSESLAASAAALGNIAGNREGGPAQLIGQTEGFPRGKRLVSE